MHTHTSIVVRFAEAREKRKEKKSSDAAVHAQETHLKALVGLMGFLHAFFVCLSSKSSDAAVHTQETHLKALVRLLFFLFFLFYLYCLFAFGVNEE
jgi:hypothetical protein